MPVRKITNKEFIRRSEIVHKKKYNYSKSKYIKSNEKVIIICPLHGKFLQKPVIHLRGSECPKCSDITAGNKIRLSQEDFIKKAIKIHGKDIYDYSETIYINTLTKIKVRCKKHNIYFGGNAKSHLYNKNAGCPKCGGEKTSQKTRLSLSEFIERAEKKHPGKYEYNYVKYINYNTPVIIKCKKHQKLFSIKPQILLDGCNCPDCAKEIKSKNITLTQEEFVKKCKSLYGNKFDFSDAVYKGCRKKVIIGCPKHGKVSIVAYYLLNGRGGCRKCGRDITGGKLMTTIDEFLDKAKKKHGSRYLYDKVRYQSALLPVEIRCKNHGIFTQTPASHMSGQGCPYCYLKNEGEVYRILKEKFPDWNIDKNKRFSYNYKELKRKRKCDFFMEKDGIKIMVEYDGEQHYRPVDFGFKNIKIARKNFKKQQLIDKLDIKFCDENNIILHRIRYNENKEKSIIKLKDKIDNLILED
jgi:hypothetical protein